MMQSLLVLEHVSKHFAVSGGDGREVLRAVEDVSLTLAPGETLGIVGESGCGKTTLARMILRLTEPTSGRILIDGADIAGTPERDLRPLRRLMQAVFQDPFGSLDPRMRARAIIAEPLVNQGWKRDRIRERVAEMMRVVGLAPEYATRYPDAFSGGQRQRIGIARALAPSPQLIVCDEAVSALDVSIQAQILNLFKDVQAEFGVAYVFISHNLAVIRHVSHRVAVMYLGRIVETAPESLIFDRPLHPYTMALMAAVPEPGPAATPPKLVVYGELPSPLDLPSGCPFHTRCPIARDICKSEPPRLEDKGGGHFASCHFAGEPLPPQTRKGAMT
jgi:oligopeptide/dipeptide ABC transporter ATP-binding protein